MRYLNAEAQIAWKASPPCFGNWPTLNARSRTIWRTRGEGFSDAVKISLQLKAMHISSRFSAQLNRSAKEPVPYSKEALRQDLARVRIAWEECQASRDRNAIYGYLTAVFDLVIWWIREDRAVSRARWALQL